MDILIGLALHVGVIIMISHNHNIYSKRLLAIRIFDIKASD